MYLLRSSVVLKTYTNTWDHKAKHNISVFVSVTSKCYKMSEFWICTIQNINVVILSSIIFGAVFTSTDLNQLYSVQYVTSQ